MKGNCYSESINKEKANDFFSIDLMSGYVNNLLTSINDDFIKKRHNTYRKRELQKINIKPEKLVFDRLYKK
jgi:hypothetical protein